ncbi:MAG: nitrilase [Campylobacterales bacterium]|nr:nitrilase [Campylobacterales bacterium]
MKVTLAQYSPKLNRSNFDDILSIIEQSASESNIIVFPELALNGYLLQDKLFEDAYTLSELQPFCDLSKDIDIAVGAAIKDGLVFRNAALYFSKGKLLSKHIKVHLPNYGMFEEARYFKAGDVFESFMTQFGKVSMLVCEDLWHKSVHHDLIKEDPDLIIALVASPARGFSDDGLKIQQQWMDIIKTVAKECSAKVIFVNRVGFEDGLGFWGGSCILDEKGDIVHQLPLFKKITQNFTI